MTVYELSKSGSVKRIDNIPGGTRLCCAFGCFDGVHTGHQALLKAAVKLSDSLNEKLVEYDNATTQKPDQRFDSAVWTFASPVSRPWIISIEERLRLCGAFGIRYAICEEFSDVCHLSPQAFLSSLVKRIGLCRGVCGYNFKFGIDRSGNAISIKKQLFDAINAIIPRKTAFDICAIPVSYDDAVTVIEPISALGSAVSSTRVRAYLAEGDIESANQLLGRRYALTGTILSGKRIGRTISRPTANLKYSKDQLIPKRGVYFSYCVINGIKYPSVTNIGYRPTVNSDTDDVTCETHLLNFSDSIYGRAVEVQFCRYARGEIAFPNIDLLSEQIAEDVKNAAEYFAEAPSEDQPSLLE